MRLTLAGLLSAVTTAVLASLGGGAAAASVSCAPESAQVKLTDRHAQVYVRGKAIYACDRRTRTTTKLGQTSVCIASARVDDLALAGDVVAYGLDVCGVDAGSTTVIVRRISDGKRLHSYAAITGPGLVESYQSIGSLVATAKGAVAWIATDSSIIGRGRRTEVHANGRLIDSGAGIVGTSLRLHGTTVRWRHGAATRTAKI